ncbi:unnamed protein product [Arctogadus glacialis]
MKPSQLPGRDVEVSATLSGSPRSKQGCPARQPSDWLSSGEPTHLLDTPVLQSSQRSARFMTPPAANTNTSHLSLQPPPRTSRGRQATAHSPTAARRPPTPRRPPGDRPLPDGRQATAHSPTAARRPPTPRRPPGDRPLPDGRQATAHSPTAATLYCLLLPAPLPFSPFIVNVFFML